jgi:hypothetical protein
MSIMSPVKRFRRNPDVVFQHLASEEGAVLLNLETGLYFGLNPVAARIWELLEAPLSERELEELVANEFQVDPNIASLDVQHFLGSLSERGLLRSDSAS